MRRNKTLYIVISHGIPIYVDSDFKTAYGVLLKELETDIKHRDKVWIQLINDIPLLIYVSSQHEALVGDSFALALSPLKTGVQESHNWKVPAKLEAWARGEFHSLLSRMPQVKKEAKK